MLLVYSRSTTRSKAANVESTANFSLFQKNYLFVFMLAMFSDWLQGPYVYELYVSYGFSQQEIAELFVCGFASSMIVGTFVGGLADKLGRKTMCVMYCVCYIMACCTKLVPEYWTLMLGRFLSGVSTSLLFSVFESWMVCEHFKQGFDASLLNETFALATFGNGMVAVIAGLIANTAAHMFGFYAPFVVAIAPLSVVAYTVSTTWTENYGNQQQNVLSSLSKGFDLVRNDSRIAALGLGQSCFEGAMYTFVFMWTPALKSQAESEAEAGGGEPSGETTSSYLGLIFAVFMVCVMIGSSCFQIFSDKKENLMRIPLYLHATAFFSMAIITVFLDYKLVVYTMFLLFEATVGVFYPSYGVIKSEKIPEDIRSAVMNIFRIPLNAFVVVLLLKIKFLSSRIVFMICTMAHGVAFLCYLYFYMHNKSDRRDIKLEEEERLMSKA
ncbi:hypothetical protein B484DRAFT_399902 [Ochromonadaceae sp. CCMP2298]|nr:hypothetical protein B484DRAFT_399902 [Ochromonadaceae sp. CCMP2298]